MIKHLHIQNYALIDSINLSLSNGLSVITGETGAGKSILLGAISLLMGARSDGKSLFDPEKKCIIEGTFSVAPYPHIQQIFEEEGIDFEEPCIIRREINPQGKSRTFVNDSPVNLDSLKKIGQELVDIHSQQDTWWLANTDFTLELVDSFAQNQTLKLAYQTSYRLYNQATKDLQALQKKAAEGTQGLDFLQFQFQELSDANLLPTEYETLRSQVEKGQNAEQINERLAQLANLMSAADISTVEQMRAALQQVNVLSKFGEDYASWQKRLESIWLETKDLANEIEREAENFQSDPNELIQSQQRLDLLNRLLQKYQLREIDQLIQLRDDIDNQISSHANLDEALALAEKQVASTFKLAQTQAAQLQANRREVYQPITQKLQESLQALGIPNATLDWEIREQEIQMSGIDKIQLLFSANKGLAPKPFRQIASGGEMSRLMLSIKHLLAEKRAMPTLILDEIDTGVSGEIAIKIGQMLTQMSHSHQIIAITHLPQIAAAGAHHWFVYKDHAGEKTVSSLRELKGEDRVDEIAKMIGGTKGYVELKENVRKLIQSNHA
ncbi:DNA repair protein RecN [Aquirufa sp.]|jgi:DNA repair protein RecN (Recombination protein N)|uniref:DNA repair protein RecN n=1 Tax=Aquirufa sp. TaxID=2676249 RepID=UPI0037C14B88